MPERASPLRPTLDQRIESIDAGRGIAILLMLFVNDIAGVNGIPSWMKHTPRGMDGLTFVDLVFPAFLFIVGMSLPFPVLRIRRNIRWEFPKSIHIAQKVIR